MFITEFDFIPRWRFDDVMISYAATGGSVGPHFDYYDVFLLKVMGRKILNS
jgi:50S ribosomal protein L16 3-hydroxylase